MGNEPSLVVFSLNREGVPDDDNRQGQLVAPYSETLHRIRMQAAAKAGDPNGIEIAYRAAMRSAEALSPWEDIQIETDDLYTQLTDRKPHY